MTNDKQKRLHEYKVHEEVVGVVYNFKHLMVPKADKKRELIIKTIQFVDEEEGRKDEMNLNDLCGVGICMNTGRTFIMSDVGHWDQQYNVFFVDHEYDKVMKIIEWIKRDESQMEPQYYYDLDDPKFKNGYPGTGDIKNSEMKEPEDEQIL